jgi:hypothetical protein
MHIAIVVDEERLQRERAMLNRLVVGLIDDGATITRVVPDTTMVEEDEESGEVRVALAARIRAPMRVTPWARRDRSRRIAEAFEKTRPDIIHAIGEHAWRLALDLGAELDAAVTLDVWSAAMMKHLLHGRNSAKVAAYIAPTPPIASALGDRLGHGLVSLVPIGVGKPPPRSPILAELEAHVAIAIVGSGCEISAYYALLDGLRPVLSEYPQAQTFLELRGPHEHEIWRHVQRLELGRQVSAITDASEHRSLITQCDLLLIPERLGETSTLTLDAMVNGLAVVAADDRWMDLLIDGTTAMLVKDADAEDWTLKIRSLLSQPQQAVALGQSARSWVLANHRSSDQANQLLATFERVLSGGSLAFTQPTG